jgi:hypothetical protein
MASLRGHVAAGVRQKNLGQVRPLTAALLQPDVAASSLGLFTSIYRALCRDLRYSACRTPGLL